MLALHPDLVHLERVVDETDFISTPSYSMDWVEKLRRSGCKANISKSPARLHAPFPRIQMYDTSALGEWGMQASWRLG